MQQKNKGGRPKLQTERKRTVGVHFKVTGQEYQVLKAKAETHGMNLSTYLRIKTLDFAKA